MTEENAKSTAPVHAVVSQQFEVWIICTRGTGHQWRKMATCDDRTKAEQLVAYHKMIDEKFPKGHYRYRVEPVSGITIGITGPREWSHHCGNTRYAAPCSCRCYAAIGE